MVCVACDVTVELCVQAHASFAFLASITGTDSVPALFANYARLKMAKLDHLNEFRRTYLQVVDYC